MTPVVDAEADVIAVVATTLREVGAEFSTLDRDTALRDLSIDSLDLLVVAETLEERFDVRISAQDIAAIRTVGDAVALVLERTRD